MPTYVYGCKHKEHGRVEVIHGFTDVPTIVCNLCGETMHRIPQVFRHYNSPRSTLLEFMEKKYINWRTRRQKGLIQRMSTNVGKQSPEPLYEKKTPDNEQRLTTETQAVVSVLADLEAKLAAMEVRLKEAEEKQRKQPKEDLRPMERADTPEPWTAAARAALERRFGSSFEGARQVLGGLGTSAD